MTRPLVFAVLSAPGPQQRGRRPGREAQRASRRTGLDARRRVRAAPHVGACRRRPPTVIPAWARALIEHVAQDLGERHVAGRSLWARRGPRPAARLAPSTWSRRGGFSSISRRRPRRRCCCGSTPSARRRDALDLACAPGWHALWLAERAGGSTPSTVRRPASNCCSRAPNGPAPARSGSPARRPWRSLPNLRRRRRDREGLPPVRRRGIVLDVAGAAAESCFLDRAARTAALWKELRRAAVAEAFSKDRPPRDTTAALACRLRPAAAAEMAALGRTVLGRTLPPRARTLWSLNRRRNAHTTVRTRPERADPGTSNRRRTRQPVTSASPVVGTADPGTSNRRRTRQR